ncbi:MAG: hypothetical protein [Caudoviricetes sp.]|nr:MAG: hypothetical protein [Caudoviricetes sp.]
MRYSRPPVVYVVRLKRNIKVSCAVSWHTSNDSPEITRKTIAQIGAWRLTDLWEIEIMPDELEVFIATLKEL